ncbi:MAG TPA: hypothetical protein DCE78_03900 [Bacteroidetes bacterium]|nr:hypothetical protein [Bacteroidota bacterium]
MDIDAHGNIYILDHVRRAILKWPNNELPILKRQTHGGISLDFNTKRHQTGVFECVPDSICVLTSNSYMNQPGSIVIDVYDSQNGHYKFSYFAENIGRFYVLNMNLSHLATINEEMEVTVWRIIPD